MMKPYCKPAQTTNLREEGSGRIILAHGEATGHHHAVYAADAETGTLPAAEFFEEPDGRRVLLCLQPCILRHQEHGAIALDPANPVQVRQGDVLLTPIGVGAWQVMRQQEYVRGALRQVTD